MSIYIDGLEMPKDREINLRIDEKGEVYVYGSYPTELHKAVPVLPHGRLIDADTLGIRDAEKQAYEALQREKGEFFAEETLIEYLRGRCDGLIHASSLVRFAPTIIPAEEAAE